MKLVLLTVGVVGGGLAVIAKLRTGSWNPLGLFNAGASAPGSRTLPSAPSAPVSPEAAAFASSSASVVNAILSSQARSPYASDNAPRALLPEAAFTSSPAPLSTIREVTGSPPSGDFSLSPGARYYVVASTSGAASSLASEARIIEEARNRGFMNVVASRARPADWPGYAVGDWYVTGTFARPDPGSLPRSQTNMLGGIVLVEVWEET